MALTIEAIDGYQVALVHDAVDIGEVLAVCPPAIAAQIEDWYVHPQAPYRRCTLFARAGFEAYLSFLDKHGASRPVKIGGEA